MHHWIINGDIAIRMKEVTAAAPMEATPPGLMRVMQLDLDYIHRNTTNEWGG
jgi:hypothetical protein